jgi:hypothetical protein
MIGIIFSGRRGRSVEAAKCYRKVKSDGTKAAAPKIFK